MVIWARKTVFSQSVLTWLLSMISYLPHTCTALHVKEQQDRREAWQFPVPPELGDLLLTEGSLLFQAWCLMWDLPRIAEHHEVNPAHDRTHHSRVVIFPSMTLHIMQIFWSSCGSRSQILLHWNEGAFCLSLTEEQEEYTVDVLWDADVALICWHYSPLVEHPMHCPSVAYISQANRLGKCIQLDWLFFL